MTGGDPAFRLEGVTREAGGRTVLRQVDLRVREGAVTTILGPSGAGKTSLLRLLNRLDEADGGRILYRGRSIRSYPVRELRRRVGFVFQTPVMFPGTVRENLGAAAEVAGRDGDAGPRVERALRLAELEEEVLDRPGDALSVGEQQRANLARALMTDPETLLLDEPTSALDPGRSQRLLATIERLCSERELTVVMATHRVGEARRLGGRGVVLVEGSVVESGSVGRLVDAPREAETRRFLGRE